MVPISYVTTTEMKHQNQQEVIIITWTWLLGTSYPRHHCISQWKTQASPIHTHLENLIQWISIYQNVVTITDEVMGNILM